MGTIKDFIAQQHALAARSTTPAVVYVGATWCPACMAFENAAKAGRLPAVEGFRFLEFDLDKSRAELAELGYMQDYLPFFVFPTARGQPTRHTIVGAEGTSSGLTRLAAQLRQLAEDQDTTSGSQAAPQSRAAS